MVRKREIRRILMCRLAVVAGQSSAQPLWGAVAVKRRRGGDWKALATSRTVATFTFQEVKDGPGPRSFTSDIAPLDLEHLFGCCRKAALVKVSVVCRGGERFVTRTSLDHLVDRLVAQGHAGQVTLMLSEDTLLVYGDDVTSTAGISDDKAKSPRSYDDQVYSKESQAEEKKLNENVQNEEKSRESVLNEEIMCENVHDEGQDGEKTSLSDVPHEKETSEGAVWEDVHLEDEEEEEAFLEGVEGEEGGGENAWWESLDDTGRPLETAWWEAFKDEDQGEEDKAGHAAASLLRVAWRHTRRALLLLGSLVLLAALLDPLLPPLE